MILYTVGALFGFGLLLQAFLRDRSTAKTDRISWLVLLVATVVWPVVLPSILVKKLNPILHLSVVNQPFTHADGTL